MGSYDLLQDDVTFRYVGKCFELERPLTAQDVSTHFPDVDDAQEFLRGFRNVNDNYTRFLEGLANGDFEFPYSETSNPLEIVTAANTEFGDLVDPEGFLRQAVTSVALPYAMWVDYQQELRKEEFLSRS